MNYRVYRHAHHAGSLLEVHDAGYFELRLLEFDEIKTKKDGEPPWKIALRKKLFADVTDLLPPELAKAYAELDKARAEWDKWGKAFDEIKAKRAELDKAFDEIKAKRAEWDKAYAELGKIMVDYGIDRLHTELCLSRNPDCPWDGKTIFPDGEELGL